MLKKKKNWRRELHRRNKRLRKKVELQLLRSKKKKLLSSKRRIELPKKNVKLKRSVNVNFVRRLKGKLN